MVHGPSIMDVCDARQAGVGTGLCHGAVRIHGAHLEALQPHPGRDLAGAPAQLEFQSNPTLSPDHKVWGQHRLLSLAITLENAEWMAASRSVCPFPSFGV